MYLGHDADAVRARQRYTGFSILVVPFSWAVGRWDIRDKTLFSFGPIRFAIHRNLGPWEGN